MKKSFFTRHLGFSLLSSLTLLATLSVGFVSQPAFGGKLKPIPLILDVKKSQVRR
ncbi:MAG: hypothetical protein ACREPR_21515 [Brasilonema sp.]